MENQAEITISEVSLRAKSKREIYFILSTEGGIYLPPIADANQKFFKGLFMGEKKCLYNREVHMTKVPQVKGLYVQDIMKFAKTHFDVENYLPDYDYDKDPNRDFLCNVVNTKVRSELQDYIAQVMSKRQKNMVTKMNLKVTCLPKFAKIFASSKNISVSNGRSHFLLRKYNRRRPHEQIERYQELEKKHQQEVALLADQLNEMRNKLKEYKEEDMQT